MEEDFGHTIPEIPDTMFVFFLIILFVHADARSRVSEGVVQYRDWREFETGNHLMANFVILERVRGEINMQEYPVLSRLLVHDPQTKCDAITANGWTTVQIGSHTCQNGQQSSWPWVTEKITSTTLRTIGMTAIAFNKPWIYAILGGTSVFSDDCLRYQKKVSKKTAMYQLALCVRRQRVNNTPRPVRPPTPSPAMPAPQLRLLRRSTRQRRPPNRLTY